MIGRGFHRWDARGVTLCSASCVSSDTEPFSLELTPQERALLGVLLEVAVCNESKTGVILK